MSNQLARLLRRDSRRCGIHLGGCGGMIEKKRLGDVDHIIPQSFFRQREPELRRSYYNGDWNCQPTHRGCNHARKGQIHGFPLFHCTCHWLQIETNESGGFCLHVFFRNDSHSDAAKHLLDSNCSFVANSPPGMEITAVGSMGIAKRGITGPGYEGHSFPRLAPGEVRELNSLELARILTRPGKSPQASGTIKKYNDRMMNMWITYETLDASPCSDDNDK